jgi:hypothetical protein
MRSAMTAGAHPLPGMAPGNARRLALQRGQGEAARPGTALAVKAAVAVVAPLTIALAVLGGIGSFATVRDLAVPWFGKSAWIVPVGIDIGILALLAWDLLTEHLGVPWPVLRWIAWLFIAGTVYLNVAAAHGNSVASVMHAAMPALFVTVTEGIRHLVRQLAGLASGTRIEGIPLARWLLAPRSSFILWRHMVLWHVTSYHDGLSLEYERMLAISRLQETYGRWLWRWKAPLRELLALRMAPAASVLGTGIPAATAPAADSQPALPAAASAPQSPSAPRQPIPGAIPPSAFPLLALLSFLPKQHDIEIEPPASAPVRLSKQDRRLVKVASALLRDAEDKGEPIAQAALARELRAQGFTIANERLRWLIETAGARPSTRQPSAQGES